MPTETKKAKYYEAVGRRKTSVARVRLSPSTKLSVEVNGKDITEYFPVLELQKNILNVFGASELSHKFAITAKVFGGGISSQSVAVGHGLARVLVEYDKELRGRLKSKGYLKRDPRAKERRKFGLKKARKAPQWSKR